MKKLLGIIFIILVLFGIYYYFQNKQTEQQNNATKKEVIKIGAILPLTGKLAIIGEGEKNGLLLAIDSLRKKYPDKKIKLIIEDFASQTKNAATLANKLIKVHNVSALITSTTAASEVVSPIVELNKIIHFVISPDLEILNKSKFNFRIYYNFKTEAKIFNDFVLSKNIKNISFLAVTYSSIQKEIEDNIIPFLEKNKINIDEKEFFDIEEKDFKNYISVIKNANSEVVFLAPQVNQVEALTKQLYQYNFSPNTRNNFVCSFTFNWRSTKFLRTLENYFIISPLFQVVDSSNVYYQAFFNKYNKIPTFDMMFAYDNLMILGDLLMKFGNNFDNFKKGFNNINKYFGASGTIDFNGNNDADVEIVLTKIKNGKQIRYSK